MRVSQVTVSLQKRVNDGDYGSEMAEAQYVVLVDEGEDADEVVRTMLDRARGRVLNELNATGNSSIRRRLNPPKRICAICHDADKPLENFESYSHEDCRERQRVERLAMTDGGVGLRRVDNDDEEDDDDDDDDDDGEVEHVDTVAGMRGSDDDR